MTPSRRWAARLGALLTLAVVTASCRGQPGPATLLHPAAERGGTYLAELARWTRTALVPDRADIALSLTAVYKSEAFRDAYLDEYAAAYRIPSEDLAVLRAEQHERARDFYEFYVLAYTADYRLNDLAARDSIWRIFLELPDGTRLKPQAIERLERRDPLLASFYPVGDAWSRPLSIRFARPAGEDPSVAAPRLVATGALGSLTLAW